MTEKTTVEAVIHDTIQQSGPFMSNMDLAREITLAIKKHGYLLVHKDMIIPPDWPHKGRNKIMKDLGYDAR